MAFERADRLEDVLRVVRLQPLPLGDERYAKLSSSRGISSLLELKIRLEDIANGTADDAPNVPLTAADERFLHAGFTGHRGCGKSTELFRLEDAVKSRFVSLHLTADEQLLSEYNYTWIFLWLADNLIEHFEDTLKIPLDRDVVDRVLRWFATQTSEDDEVIAKEIGLDTEAAVGVEYKWFGIRAKLMATLKSMIRGSHESRQRISQTLQKYSSDLLRHLNELLDAARLALARRGGPQRILVVIDNLDRLPFNVSNTLFFHNSGILTSLHADVIYTVPVAIAMDRNIRTVFPVTVTMPMVKLRTRANRRIAKARDALMDAVAKRLDIEKLFEKPSDAEFLCEMSGGSIRDLMRLVEHSAVAARADGRTDINRKAARRAVTDMRLDFERLLLPADSYFPKLARLHLTKSDWLVPGDPAEPEHARKWLRELLFNGIVLEYNGSDHWYDVHPAVREIEAFRAEYDRLCAHGKSNDQSNA